MSQFKTCRPSTMSREQFVELFADIYEHSAWVAEKVFDQGLVEEDNKIDILQSKMAKILNESTKQQQLDLINAHPDLAGKAAINGELTDASTSEQSGAGIQLCSPEEFDRFTNFNSNYKHRFNFPFIMAVKGANRYEILDSFEVRLGNDSDTEFATAIQEINKIALFRLRDM